MRARRALRVGGGIVGALFLVIAFTPAPNAALARLAPAPDLRPADAIVVLGAGVDEGGVLGDASLRRALEGIRLARLHLAPTLLLLGPSQKTGPSEAAVRERLATDLGVDPATIVSVPDAYTTGEEAVRSRERLPPAVRTILLVTGSHHMPRAAALFRRIGFDVRVAPVDELGLQQERPEGRLGMARSLAQEMAGWAFYRLRGRL
jgi:uncharacterized SAM-binding protein YcdF (DUF218 family)